MEISWPQKKKRMVHDMVQLDSFNNQMRSQIKETIEDINVLRDQVAKLERRLNFAKDKSQTVGTQPHWVDLSLSN